jgi:signal transduction histidine kinase
VRSRIDTLAPWASTREVTLAGLGDADAVIDGDAVARAIDNLVRNAVEASPPAARVEARVEEDERNVIVRVRDVGVGVPVDRIAELFEPFFTTKPAGTGLGLALARAIARAHGGDVTYLREDGATWFELTLPKAQPQGDRAAA